MSRFKKMALAFIVLLMGATSSATAENWCKENPERADEMMRDLLADYQCSLGSLSECGEILGYGLGATAAVAGATAMGVQRMARPKLNISNICAYTVLDSMDLLQNALFPKAFAAASCKPPQLMVSSNVKTHIGDSIADLERMDKEQMAHVKANKPKVEKAYKGYFKSLERDFNKAHKTGKVKLSEDELRELRRLFGRLDDPTYSNMGAAHYEKFDKHLRSVYGDRFAKEFNLSHEKLVKDKYIKNMQNIRTNRESMKQLKGDLSKKLDGMNAKNLGHHDMKYLRGVYDDLPHYVSTDDKINIRRHTLLSEIDYFDPKSPVRGAGGFRDSGAVNRFRTKQFIKSGLKNVFKFIPLVAAASAMADPMGDMNFVINPTGCADRVSDWGVIDQECHYKSEWNVKTIDFLNQPYTIRLAEVKRFQEQCDVVRDLHNLRGPAIWSASCVGDGGDAKLVSREKRGEVVSLSVDPRGVLESVTVEARGTKGQHTNQVIVSEGKVESVRMMPQFRSERSGKKRPSSVEELFSSSVYYSEATFDSIINSTSDREVKKFARSYGFFQANMTAYLDVAACCAGVGSPTECKRYGIAPKSVPTSYQGNSVEAGDR